VSCLFGNYARLIKYPIKVRNSYGWRLVYDLGKSFSFLLDCRSITYKALRSSRTFYIALAGIVDSEGHVGLRKSASEASPVVTITNGDASLVRIVCSMLHKRGYHFSIELKKYETGPPCYEIFLTGRYALHLLRRLVLHHPEKIAARRIVMSYARNPTKAYSNYQAVRRRTKLETRNCINEAKYAYLRKDSRKLRKITAYYNLVSAARKLRDKGRTTREIGISIERSQRTVYRLLQRDIIGKRKTTKAESIDKREKPVSSKTRL